MRKAILTLMIVVGALAARAYDYPYLAFETASGEVTTVAVESLALSFSGGNLVATDSEGTHTFALTDLKRMCFTTSSTSVIDTTLAADGEVEVYNIAGVELGRFAGIDDARRSLPSGIYLIKTNRGTQKIAVR